MEDMLKNNDGWLNLEIGTTLIPPDFKTHLNYITQMRDISEGLQIKLNLHIDSKAKFSKDILSKKINLIRMIKESLDEEKKKASKEKDFAKVCSIWIPVKSYYLIFNQLLVLCSLVNNDENNLSYPHSKAISNFRNMIKNKTISFDKGCFNRVCTCLEAINFKSKSGESLKWDVDEESRINSILKKICRYKFEDFCRFEGLKNFRKKISRNKRDGFFKKNEISLFEFFYWYRIKANYRDLTFLDQEVYSEEMVKFYDNYYQFTINFYNALKDLINEISKKRVGENILA